MKLTLEHDGDEYMVWAMLDDGREVKPAERSESFVIGTGATADEAITSAIKALERAMDELDHLRDRAEAR